MDISSSFWPFVHGVLTIPYEILVTTPEFDRVCEAEMAEKGIMLSLDALQIPASVLNKHPNIRVHGSHVAFEHLEHAIIVLVELYKTCGDRATSQLLDECLDVMLRRARLNEAIDEMNGMALGG